MGLILVVGAGAALTIGSATITGYRLHLWLIKHAPGFARGIPRDGGVVLGFALGCAAVAGWWFSG